MTLLTPELWNRHIRATLLRYDEALLRQVAHKLCKPRNQWPINELLDRVVSALNNAAMVDRRLKELPVACKQILGVIARSRQSRWPVGSLVEILVMLGHSDGVAPLTTLLESGLLCPELFPLGSEEEDVSVNHRAKLKSIEVWLARSEPMPVLQAFPSVLTRAVEEDLGIICPEVTVPTDTKVTVHEADGLDWPLRLAVLWQQLLQSPLRRTQQGEFFKRDFDRLQSDPLLSASPTDTLAPLTNPGFFAVALAFASGLLKQQDTELHTADYPAAWKSSLAVLLTELCSIIPHLTMWNPVPNEEHPRPGNPYSSAYMMALLLLTRLPEAGWTSPRAVEEWIAARHPYWLGNHSSSIGIENFLLSIAYSLRLLQGTKGSDGSWLIRLSPLGRWVLQCGEKVPAIGSFKQTLLVQPNLEILAYRQGLTPELIVSLSKIATWKGLGPACTLQLEPHSVYRALEMGETLTSIVQLLEGHGMKALPSAVLDSLKTWSNKRERISIYTAGVIFEFASAAELNEALARGLSAVRITDKLAIVANEDDIDFKHFRLTVSRDYTLPPEKCVDIEADGVTLSVDLARSDLLLDTELMRFAEPIQRLGVQGRRHYRLTPTTIAAARQQGMTLGYLETWFQQRTGLSISPAAKLLLTGPDSPPVSLQRQLVLHVGSEAVADGLQQWPATRELLIGRLGPAALVVPEQNVEALTLCLKELGVKMHFEG